jgi:predicted transcriptional regulator
MNAEQLRAGRGMLRWSQKELSDASGVSVPTIKRLEALEGDLNANLPTINALRGAMEKGGLVFIPANGGGAGVRLAKP